MKPNKIIVVTGGSGLLGKAIVNECLAAGNLVINFDLTAYESASENKIVDTTDYDQVKIAMQEVLTNHGRIDGLVNNAYPRTKDWGIPLKDDVKLQSWKKNIDLQLNSYVMCCQIVVDTIGNQANLSVINMTSIYGVVGNDMSIYNGTGIIPVAAYSAIKGGLINFTRFMASLHGKDGFRFNCISPGGIFDHQDPIFVKNYEDKVPMQRMGTPQDIAPSVNFLISDGAKYITGQNIIIDGGWTCV